MHVVHKKAKSFHWRHILTLLFLSKSAILFYCIFAITNSLTFLLYFYNLTIFAVGAKVFAATNAVTQNPTGLLLGKFSCSAKLAYLLCGGYFWLFLVSIVGIEAFTIWTIVRLRKKLHRLPTIIFLLSMQLFTCISFLTVLFTPAITYANLYRQASNDTQVAFSQVNEPHQRTKKGILDTTDAIAKKLATTSTTDFTILESNPYEAVVLNFLNVKLGKKDTFYRSVVLSTVIQANKKTHHFSFDVLFFPNNTLVVAHRSKTAIETLIPIIAIKIIRNEFPTYIEQNKPQTLSFLNTDDYNNHEKDKQEKIKQEYESYIAYLYNFFKESDDIIHSNQDFIASYPNEKLKLQKEYDDYISQYGSWYQDCKNALGNDLICEHGKSKIDENIGILKDNIRQLDEARSQADGIIARQEGYKYNASNDLDVAKKNYEDFLKNPVTPELQDGVFNPPNEVYVKYYNDNKPFTYYLNTMVHEDLHFYSFTGDQTLDTFLEEGTTEYLKFVILSKYIEKESLDISYPYEVSVVVKLLQQFPKNRYLDIYFTKNQDNLKKLFVEKYTAATYDNFILSGRNMFYTPLGNQKLRDKYLTDISKLLGKK